MSHSCDATTPSWAGSSRVNWRTIRVMGDATVEVNGVRLWYDLAGPVSGSAVILIPGAASQATFWPAALVDPLVAGGHQVLRFDPRDIGRSEWVDFESHPYTAEDQAADIVGLMDVLSIERAHIVGFSGGGVVAQVLALDHPERVLSLTSWASSPAPTDPNLPQMKPEIVQQVLQPAETEHERVEQRIAILRAFAGSRLGFDEAQERARVESDMRRGQNPACAHAQVGFAAPPRTERLRSMGVPTLVRYTATRIPRCRCRMGRSLPPRSRRLGSSFSKASGTSSSPLSAPKSCPSCCGTSALPKPGRENAVPWRLRVAVAAATVDSVTMSSSPRSPLSSDDTGTKCSRSGRSPSRSSLRGTTALRRRRHRRWLQQAQLEQHAEVVEDAPLLRDLSVFHSDMEEVGDFDRLLGRRW